MKGSSGFGNMRTNLGTGQTARCGKTMRNFGKLITGVPFFRAIRKYFTRFVANTAVLATSKGKRGLTKKFNPCPF
jgi:hypothetical protein